MKFTIASAIIPLFLASQAVASAVCPGNFELAIGNQVGLENGANKCKCYTLPQSLTVNDDRLFAFFLAGQVYDQDCNVVDGLSTTGNPCNYGIFGCSPAPIKFNSYTPSPTTFTGAR